MGPVPQVPQVRQELYTIPSYASWFHMDRMHERERTACPEFFGASSSFKTPRVGYWVCFALRGPRCKERPVQRLALLRLMPNVVLSSCCLV
jgi:hypothetical protein